MDILIVKLFLCIQTDEAALLRKSIKVHTEKAVREAIHLVRIAAKYKKLRAGHKNEGCDPSVILIFDNGFFTTVSGSGELFNVFCKEKYLGPYTGKNYIVHEPCDPGYRYARLRHLPFDHCFNYMEEDVDKRAYIYCRYHNLYINVLGTYHSYSFIFLFIDEEFDPSLDTHHKITGISAG